VQIETKFGAGLSCHFAVDKLHSFIQSSFSSESLDANHQAYVKKTLIYLLISKQIISL
jgi:hypothetical protein